MSASIQETQEAAEWAEAWAGDLAYRPGWTFRIEHQQVLAFDPGTVTLTVTVETEDVTRIRPTVRLGHTSPITPEALARDEDALARRVWSAIGDLEGHERFELLRRHGTPVIDPHPWGPGSEGRFRLDQRAPGEW